MVISCSPNNFSIISFDVYKMSLAEGQNIDHVPISLRAFTTEDFKVPDKMVGFSK